ncbi:NCS1 nucleoside transporter [Biscogniauxia marginata]|nr:NCS1 nucleoside transporter [Biscogniauxia marginata]
MSGAAKMLQDPPHGDNGHVHDRHLTTAEQEDVKKTAGRSHAFEAGVGKLGSLQKLAMKAISAGPVEERGVLPVPLEERTSTKYSSYFSIWACININLLPITFGLLGSSTFGLSLRDCALVILFFCLLTAAIPVYLGTLGPKTGLRQMIQARYSFGRYLVCIPVVLNLATLTGFCVVICVIGGQCLSAVTGGTLTPDVGIVIIGVLAMLVSFCGYFFLHSYEKFAWVPAVIAIVIVTGCGGSHLHDQAPTEPATAASVLSFGGVIASYMIPYATLSSDFTTYLNPKFPSWRLFLYGYAGLVIPPVLLMTLGAAIGGAISNVPGWQEGYDTTAVGGVLASMASSAGGFGEFIVVALAFTMLGNISATMYSITLNFQILVPQLVRVPRYVFSIVVTAIVIPVSIKAATDFFDNLENFIALIGYWSAAFSSALITEHVVFRRCQYDTYDPKIWNTASRLPLGIAAITASALSFALVIPSMAQVWFTGPIAKSAGDIGFELAFVLTAVFYIPLRIMEKKLSGR